MKPFLPFLAVVVALVGAFPLPSAVACECRRMDVQKEFASAKAVFSGKVTFVAEDHTYAIFEVLQSWKEAKTKTVEIQLNEKGRLDGCSLYPHQNEEFLVFAYGDKVLTTSQCATRPLAESVETVKELNEQMAASAQAAK